MTTCIAFDRANFSVILHNIVFAPTPHSNHETTTSKMVGPGVAQRGIKNVLLGNDAINWDTGFA